MDDTKHDDILFISRSRHLEREIELLREFATERLNFQERTRISDWEAHRDVHKALKEEFANYKHEIEIRLSKLNELRETVEKDREMYARKENIESRDQNMETKITALDKGIDEIIRWKEVTMLRIPTLESTASKNVIEKCGLPLKR